MTDNGIKRICISTTNIEKSQEFFSNDIGLSIVASAGFSEAEVEQLFGIRGSSAKYVMLKNEEQPTLLQLIEFSKTPSVIIRDGRPSWDYGYYDVAFRAKNNSAEFDYFTGKGFEYYCPPTRYVADWINLDVLEAVLKGPDNIPMALIERLKEPIPEFSGRFSIFTDCAVTVRDGDEATRFYVEVLGMEKVFDEVLPDGLVDDIVGVPHGTQTRMLMYSGGNTPITECLEYSLKGRSMSDTAKPENAGIYAVAYETEDVHALVNLAAEKGFGMVRGISKVVMEPYGEILTAVISGPSEMLVEVFQRIER